MNKRIWAGSLHINPKELGKKKKKRSSKEELFGESRANANKRKTKQDIINEYFSEISTGKALSIKKAPNEQSTGTVGEAAV